MVSDSVCIDNKSLDSRVYFFTSYGFHMDNHVPKCHLQVVGVLARQAVYIVIEVVISRTLKYC